MAANVVKGIGGFVASRQQSKALKGQAREEENAGAAQSLRIRETARKAIGDTVVRTSALRTVHRVGYRFVGTPEEATA